MSIRMLAKELYQLRQDVERLERALASAAAGQREKIEAQLREAKADRNHLRALLDGRKDSPGKPGRQTGS
jgi:septal ring factor EnvC (AmiA/AmiB activator)